MKFNQHVILKHEYGITAQWMSADWTQTAIATYQQNDIKTTKHNPDPDASIDKMLFGAETGSKLPFENLWKGTTIGFEKFWPEDSNYLQVKIV